jgi:hypothetical protein
MTEKPDPKKAVDDMEQPLHDLSSVICIVQALAREDNGIPCQILNYIGERFREHEYKIRDCWDVLWDEYHPEGVEERRGGGDVMTADLIEPDRRIKPNIKRCFEIVDIAENNQAVLLSPLWVRSIARETHHRPASETLHEKRTDSFQQSTCECGRSTSTQGSSHFAPFQPMAAAAQGFQRRGKQAFIAKPAFDASQGP